LSGAEAFWKDKFSKVSLSGILISYFKMMLNVIQPVNPFKAPPPLTSKGSYSGTSRANILKKQATLRKAAAGSAKISGFFASVPMPTRQPIEVLEIESSSSEGSSSDSEEEDWVDIPSLPLEPHSSVTPVPGTLVSDTAELLSDNNLSNSNTDLVPPPISFLDPIADDEFGPEHIPTSTLVASLIKDAMKHKAFGALFKLHAI
jgi:hypothetical protein